MLLNNSAGMTEKENSVTERGVGERERGKK